MFVKDFAQVTICNVKQNNKNLIIILTIFYLLFQQQKIELPPDMVMQKIYSKPTAIQKAY